MHAKLYLSGSNSELVVAIAYMNIDSQAKSADRN
jgi:hypothetical protein